MSEESLDIPKPVSPSPKPLSRRSFIKAAVAVGASLVGLNSAPPVPDSSPQPSSSPEPALLNPEYPTLERNIDLYRKEDFSGGFSLYFRNEVPVAYQYPETEVSWFSTEETTEFKEKIASAKKNNWIEALTVTIDPLTPQEPEQTGEKAELPKDMFTAEQLKEKGIAINIADSGVSMGVLPSAFEKGGLFEPLELLRKKTDENISLEVFMLDAPKPYYTFIDPEKYPVQREFMSIALDEPLLSNEWQALDCRDELIWGVENELGELTEELKRTTVPHEAQEIQRKIMARELMTKYYKNLPDKRILQIRASQMTKIAGTADYSLIYDPETLDAYKLRGKLGIFIAAQSDLRAHRTLRRDIIALPDGTVNSVQLSTLDWLPPSMTVEPDKNNPSPDNFKIDETATEENGGYITLGSRGTPAHIGQVVRHEIIHAWLWKWLPSLQKHGLLEQLSFYDKLLEIEGIDGYLEMLKSNKLQPENNEFVVDSIALKTIEEAFERWHEEGDDSGFSLVFYTNGPNRRIQISQIQPTKSEQSVVV